MNTTPNMMSTYSSTFDTTLKNKGFALLDKMFKEHGWYITKNEMDWICYTRPEHETEYFEIKITKDKVFISSPVKNTAYQYSTTFKDYFSASEYLESRFYDYIC